MALNRCSVGAPAIVALSALSLALATLAALAIVASAALAIVASAALAIVALNALPGNMERMHVAVCYVFAQLMLPLQNQLTSQELLTVK